MNKLQGFIELDKTKIPCIPWKEFNEDTILDDNMLYSIRTAVYKGDDFHLPKKIGINGKEGYSYAMDLYKKYKDKGIVIYYPYFHAEKSGNVIISSKELIIEAVEGDLWNLNQHNNVDLTIIKKDKTDDIYNGKKDFLSDNEVKELQKYVERIKRQYRYDLVDGKSILLEWSYGYNVDTEKRPIGDRYLIFMELRTIK